MGAYKRELYMALDGVGIRDVQIIDRAMKIIGEETSDFMPNPDRVAQCFKDASAMIRAEAPGKLKRLPMKPSDRAAGKHQINMLRQKRARGELL